MKFVNRLVVNANKARLMFCINFPTYGLDRQLNYTQKARVGLPHSAADNRPIITDITFWY